MKTGKKVMILLLVFVAAAMVYFVHPVGKKEEHGVTEYTAMEKAKIPGALCDDGRTGDGTRVRTDG